ncbi:MAG: IS200/IS605 family transposase [Bacteroidota bacterium]
MSTYTQVIYQIVFGTKHRNKTLEKPHRDQLFKYITGLLQKKQCHLYQIGGVEDHIHILTDLHPTIALSSLVKDIKMATTDYIKRENLFPDFRGWQNGYGAFTYSIREKDRLIEYVKRQEQHHRKLSSKEEYMMILKEEEVEYDEQYIL